MTILADGSATWSSVIMSVVFGFGALVLLAAVAIALLRTYTDFRKARIVAGHEEQLRDLIRRFEQLSTATLDAQQRVAADLAEVRTRIASIEQVLRTVE